MFQVSEISLQALAIENFRPFTKRIELKHLTKLNVIAGPNNVGKSSILMPLRRLTRIDERFVPRLPVPDGQGHWGSVHSALFYQTDLRKNDAPPRIVVRLCIPDLPAIFGAWFLQRDTQPPQLPSGGPTEIALEFKGQGYFQINFSDASRSALSAFHNEFPKHALRPFDDGDVDAFALDIAKAFAARIVFIPTFRVAGKSYQHPDVSTHQERMFDGSGLLAELLSWWLPDPGTGATRANSRVAQLNETYRRCSMLRCVSGPLRTSGYTWPSVVTNRGV